VPTTIAYLVTGVAITTMTVGTTQMNKAVKLLIAAPINGSATQDIVFK